MTSKSTCTIFWLRRLIREHLEYTRATELAFTPLHHLRYYGTAYAPPWQPGCLVSLTSVAYLGIRRPGFTSLFTTPDPGIKLSAALRTLKTSFSSLHLTTLCQKSSQSITTHHHPSKAITSHHIQAFVLHLSRYQKGLNDFSDYAVIAQLLHSFSPQLQPSGIFCLGKRRAPFKHK